MCWNGVLLLVSFYTPWMGALDQGHINAISQSPYHGVAVPLVEQFNTDPVSLNQLLKLEIQDTQISQRIWPWIYFNRFVGLDKDKKPRHKRSKKPYFENIIGLDVFDKSGTLTDFKTIFKAALLMAKKSGSNGIVLDPEVYNDYETYKISYLARKLGITEQAVIKRLTTVGEELTDIAAEVNPDATIWFLMTGLGGGRIGLGNKKKDYERSISYIIKGMLNRANDKKLRLSFVSGGELTMGYCFRNTNDLKNMITKRGKRFENAKKQFPSLKLGASIAPWDKSSSKKRWMLKGRCKHSVFGNINDFKPAFKQLTDNYKYIWVYGAVAGNYNIYNSNTAPILNKTVAGIFNSAESQCQ